MPPLGTNNSPIIPRTGGPLQCVAVLVWRLQSRGFALRSEEPPKTSVHLVFIEKVTTIDLSDSFKQFSPKTSIFGEQPEDRVSRQILTCRAVRSSKVCKLFFLFWSKPYFRTKD